jgi:hypothetical protein
MSFTGERDFARPHHKPKIGEHDSLHDCLGHPISGNSVEEVLGQMADSKGITLTEALRRVIFAKDGAVTIGETRGQDSQDIAK